VRLYRDVAPAMLVASVLALAILLSILGCRESDESPTAPGPGPALATTATALSFRQLSVGTLHSCGVTTDNVAYCWGNNHEGELGNGTTSGSGTPVKVAGGLRFDHGSAGFDQTCGVTTKERAYVVAGATTL
jgi:hypothetical protein